MLLLTHGDVENNPGPKRRTSNYFSCCHWNVNSIMAHNKLPLQAAYNTLHKLAGFKLTTHDSQVKFKVSQTNIFQETKKS